MRERIVIGNWKMNPPTIADAVELARAVADRMPRGVHVGVAPPAVALPAVADALRDANVDVYAQDVHWEERGAFTGQISVSMVGGLAEGTIVGHSEVRRDLGDTDARVAKKLARAVAGGLRPVLCVGESAAEHAAGEATAVVARQIAADVAQAERRGLERLVIAYEPVWAIGTGNPATGEHAMAAARAIRAALKHAGLDAEAIPVLYGGSVSARSVREFAEADGIDGALVGGASLDPDEFAAVVRAFA
ncbi:MAG TPA: triose-phosphate isomerase [Candidatus Udaeobacter sp.]|nr:triose-phosphate isomerase [Candidatus Udaeobacter sp.]